MYRFIDKNTLEIMFLDRFYEVDERHSRNKGDQWVCSYPTDHKFLTLNYELVKSSEDSSLLHKKLIMKILRELIYLVLVSF